LSAQVLKVDTFYVYIDIYWLMIYRLSY
jgi:hypothetical protein